MYKLALVLRYLRKRKITFFPIAGVALGVMALVVVLSVMEGFDTDFRRLLRGISPDMTLTFMNVEGYGGELGGDVDLLVRTLEAVPEVRAVSPMVEGLALVDIMYKIPGGPIGYDGVAREYVHFRGFDYAREKAVLGLDGFLKYGDDPFAGYAHGESETAPIIAGARLVGRRDLTGKSGEEDWGLLDKGNVMEMLTFTPDYSRAKVRGAVVDVVKSGIYDIDAHIAYMPLDWARAFRRLGADTVTGVGIGLHSYTAAEVASARMNIQQALNETLPFSVDFRLTTWEEQRRTFLTAVAMERRIMAFILFFFLIVAGFSISAILIMIVLEKIRDIGILRAMGSSAAGIAQVFLIYGVTIGLVGALAGLGLGVAFVQNLDVIEQAIYEQTGWEPFPPDIYDLPAIPKVLNWRTNFYIVASAMAVSFAASVVPAVRAAMLNPVEAIRYE